MFFYYLEVFFTIIALLFVGAIFTPFVGGCLTVMLFVAILGAVIVFFSLNFIWIIAIGLVVYFCGWLLKFYRWYKLPKLADYFDDNPQCNLNGEIACKNCNSTKIKHLGVFNHSSRYRYYTCLSCGHVLYRFTVL
jgi:fatty acid desaturase